MKEYLIEDLLKQSQIVLGVDTEHYPWFAVYKLDDGKFLFTETNYRESGMGYDSAKCNEIGIGKYDEALFFNVKSFDSFGFFAYRMISSDIGYLALGHGDIWDIYCLSCSRGAAVMVEAAPSREDAFSKLSERIGYSPESDEWKDLSRCIKYTPENITELDSNQIFVFGSNLQGRHGGGAAYCALKNFGAVMGQGVGLQGRSYAIPTMFETAEEIKPYVDKFVEFAKENSHLEFLVTRIGCNIAGFSEEDIAPLFYRALSVRNIILPKSFVEVLKRL